MSNDPNLELDVLHRVVAVRVDFDGNGIHPEGDNRGDVYNALKGQVRGNCCRNRGFSPRQMSGVPIKVSREASYRSSRL